MFIDTWVPGSTVDKYQSRETNHPPPTTPMKDCQSCHCDAGCAHVLVGDWVCGLALETEAGKEEEAEETCCEERSRTLMMSEDGGVLE